MELVESNDPKSLLLQQSAKHKKNLEDEIKMVSENTEKAITNALIIGGTLAVTYFIVRQLTKSKSKRKAKAKKTKSFQEDDSTVENSSAETKSDPSIMSQIGSAIAAQATVFLLDMAKDKLSAYLQAYLEKEADTTNERS